jgi:hypothetical protein
VFIAEIKGFFRGKVRYNQLKKASLVWISSRSKHPNADPKRQLEFKKNLKKT